MIQREALEKLIDWKSQENRKPLVIRGPRQVGKSTLVKEFSKKFDHFVSLNLDLAEHKRYFTQNRSLKDVLSYILFDFEVPKKSEVLIFLDEIQEEPEAIEQLRYFYEEFSQYYVIAAGSLLETLTNPEIHFPVGRVEYMVLRPVSFAEYLESEASEMINEAYQSIPVKKEACNKLLNYFHDYTLLGGMPEVLSNYIQHKDIVRCNKIFDNLLTSYLDDVEKYAGSKTEQQVIRHCIRSVFYEANNRITFQGFGKSNYKSREVGEALRSLEKAMLIHLVYPNTEIKPPLLPDHKRKPRLQLFDTGIMNYYAQLQRKLMGSDDLSDAYQGKVIEHIVGQEILSTKTQSHHGLQFWVRDKKGSSAEIDFLIQIREHIIPVEVKSGKAGKLKSLHQYMEISSAPVAVRLYAGEMTEQEVKTPSGKTFTLLSLPYYLAGKLDQYVEWWLNKN